MLSKLPEASTYTEVSWTQIKWQVSWSGSDDNHAGSRADKAPGHCRGNVTSPTPRRDNRDSHKIMKPDRYLGNSSISTRFYFYSEHAQIKMLEMTPILMIISMHGGKARGRYGISRRKHTVNQFLCCVTVSLWLKKICQYFQCLFRESNLIRFVALLAI